MYLVFPSIAFCLFRMLVSCPDATLRRPPPPNSGSFSITAKVANYIKPHNRNSNRDPWGPKKHVSDPYTSIKTSSMVHAFAWLKIDSSVTFTYVHATIHARL